MEGRIFAVASDEALVDLINRAKTRLVVIAPALTKPVAEALARRLPDLGELGITVVLDADPEVYRLGFGDEQALEAFRAVSAKNGFDLREQPGVRIGVVISDATTMVYSPVSRNIEAGSVTIEKPNAIILRGGEGDLIASAAGADNRENPPPQEVGNTALSAGKVAEMQSNLKANPPKPFDIARKMNIFSSKVQYVEFSVSNYQLTTRKIPLPPELVDVADEDLKSRITSRIRAPFDGIGKVEVTLTSDGKTETIKVDDRWLRTERKRIEDEYTYPINNFGRVILYNDRGSFDEATTRFRIIIEKYQSALQGKLSASKADFEKRIIDEFEPKWAAKPPALFKRWQMQVTADSIRTELQKLAHEIFEGAISFDDPKVKVLYKNVAPENIRDPTFLDVLKGHMIRRRVPRAIINTLFESGEAAPEAGAFVAQ
jgi:hypothetical protein